MASTGSDHVAPPQRDQEVEEEHPRQQVDLQQSPISYQQPENRNSNILPSYHSCTSMTVGFILIADAGLAIIFNAMGIVLQNGREDDKVNYGFNVGGGFLSSTFFLVCAGLAIGASRRKNRRLIVANLITSILSFATGLVLLATGVEAHRDEMALTLNAQPSVTMAILLMIVALIGMLAATVSAVNCGLALYRDCLETSQSRDSTRYMEMIPTNAH